MFFFNILIISAQKQTNEKSILIYSEGQGYLKPFIEKTIKELQLVKFEKPYFKRVNLFNRFILDNKYQSELRDLVDRQKPEGINFNAYYSNSEKEIRRRIFNILIDYDYFLVIKTTALGELIEFQFELYATEKSNVNTNLINVPFTISDKLVGVENFFINPKDSNYKTNIADAIKRLFKGSNKPPIVELKIFDKKIISGDIINIPIDRIIKLDGSNSGDFDSKELVYIWRNIPPINEKLQTFDKINLENGKPIAQINIEDFGYYNIGFKVYDGISYSDEIEFTLKAVSKPEVIVRDSIIYSVHYASIVNDYHYDNEFEGRIEYLSHDFSNKINDKLILSSRPLTKTSEIKLNTRNIDTTGVYSINNRGNNEVTIKTRFINKEKIIYAHNMSKKYNIVSDPVKIRHKLIRREVVNLYPKISVSSITDFQAANNENDEFINSSHLTLGLGVFLTKKIEVEFSLPLTNSRNVNYNEFEFLYPAKVNTSIKYYFYKDKSDYPEDLNSIFIGPIHSVFGVIENEETSLSINSLGIKFGWQTRVFDYKTIHFDFFVDTSYSKFIDRKELSDTGDFGLNIGLKARFK